MKDDSLRVHRDPFIVLTSFQDYVRACSNVKQVLLEEDPELFDYIQKTIPCRSWMIPSSASSCSVSSTFYCRHCPVVCACLHCLFWSVQCRNSHRGAQTVVQLVSRSRGIAASSSDLDKFTCLLRSYFSSVYSSSSDQLLTINVCTSKPLLRVLQCDDDKYALLYKQYVHKRNYSILLIFMCHCALSSVSFLVAAWNGCPLQLTRENENSFSRTSREE